uniref:Uncharacterized protein n=2 Tax=Opuntia streptacantha TaxID=393608 RepID=A0A7C8YZ76_OPUST
MGNHCCGSSSAVWAAEAEWVQMRPVEREELLGGGDDHDHQAYLSSAEGSTAGGQVRIRISKKQLEELLKRMEPSGAQKKKKMKVDQALLQRLIEKSYDFEFHHHHDHHQRPWKPALQSIPEVN